MSNIKGTNIASLIAPFTTDDAYPTHDAKYGKGGYKTVNTIIERNDIPVQRLSDGCICYVKDEDQEYRWDAEESTWNKVLAGLSEEDKEKLGMLTVQKGSPNNLSVNGELSANGDIKWSKDGEMSSITDLSDNLDNKIDKDGVKTINGESILGTGDITISVDTQDYNTLENKPSINGTTLTGDISGETLGIPEKLSENCQYTNQDVKIVNENGDKTIVTINKATAGTGGTAGVMTSNQATQLETLSETFNISPDSVSSDKKISAPDFSSDKVDSLNDLSDKVDSLQLFKFPNVTIFGTPTINNGQISDFSQTDYMQFPFLVDFHNQAFEIKMCFTTGPQVTNQENIFDSIDGLAFAVRNSKFVIAMSSDGQTWNMGEHVGTFNVQPNTTYYVNFSWNRLVYTLKVSVDGQTYSDDIRVVDSRSLFAKQIIIGKSTDNLHIFSGSINLNNCSLSIMGQEIWQGMDDAGLATRLATDLSNIDEAGMKKIQEIAVDPFETMVMELSFVNGETMKIDFPLKKLY